MKQKEIRGDVFCDRLGGVTEIVLAAVALGMTLFRKPLLTSDLASASLFGIEIIGACFIMTSRLAGMRVALWLFSIRVLAGLAYMGMVHDDKLARSTLGFPILVLLYCIIRVRALRHERR